MCEELPAGVKFFRAEAASKYLGLKPKRLCNIASQEADGSVWKQCRYGLWHIEQIKIIEVLILGKMTKDEANALWEIAKERLKNEIQQK